MREVSDGYHDRIMAGQKPIIYLIVTTIMGDRVYSNRGVDMTSTRAPLLDHNGDFVTDHNGEQIITAVSDFSFSALSVEARVITFGTLGRELTNRKSTIVGSYNFKKQESFSFSLSNHDDAIAELMPQEPFIGAAVTVYAGFNDLAAIDHFPLFTGEITDADVNGIEVDFQALEGADFSETLYLPRAGTYNNPKNNNDLIPIVYGDMTDGSEGVWECRLIDTVNYVYAFAAHEVIAHTPTVYIDDVETPSGWTFDEKDNYESNGDIATLTFTADQGNAKITVRGQGKPTATGGGTLMESVVDIVADFLTVHASFDSTKFHTTSRTIVGDKYDAQNYKAAGCVVKDAAVWETAASMMGSFLGSIWKDQDGKVYFDIDDGTTPEMEEIIPGEDIEFVKAILQREDIVNRCRASYRYNYAGSRFASHTDDSNFADAVSISTYGTRTPSVPFQTYFCRDITSVNALQTIIVANQKDPTYEIDLLLSTFRWLQIDPGDVFGVTIKQLFDDMGNPMTRQKVRIVGHSPNLDNLTITIRAFDLKTGYLEYSDGFLVDHNVDFVTDHNSDQIATYFLE